MRTSSRRTRPGSLERRESREFRDGRESRESRERRSSPDGPRGRRESWEPPSTEAEGRDGRRAAFGSPPSALARCMSMYRRQAKASMQRMSTLTPTLTPTMTVDTPLSSTTLLEPVTVGVLSPDPDPPLPPPPPPPLPLSLCMSAPDMMTMVMPSPSMTKPVSFSRRSWVKLAAMVSPCPPGTVTMERTSTEPASSVVVDSEPGPAMFSLMVSMSSACTSERSALRLADQTSASRSAGRSWMAFWSMDQDASASSAARLPVPHSRPVHGLSLSGEGVGGDGGDGGIAGAGSGGHGGSFSTCSHSPSSHGSHVSVSEL
mmetsp:Transcript_27229/g.73346  ORF Transcript_27229/g.73346 Transcript_27229/m.73346 type:complete len:317 (-) Transcript_27229:23-973(-)